MDAPLLNRFEKQVYRSFEDLSPIDTEIRGNLNQWLIDISHVDNFDLDSMFPAIHSDENSHLYALNSLVTLSKQVAENQDTREEYCKNVLIQLATQAGIIRSKESNA